MQAASRKVLGVSYDELAAEVMRLWGWPDALQQAARKLQPRDPDEPASKEDYVRVVCTAANRLAAELDGADSAPALERCLADFQRDFAVPIGLAEEDLAPMVERARAQWGDLALVLGFAKMQAKQQSRAVPARSRDAAPSRRADVTAQAPVESPVARHGARAPTACARGRTQRSADRTGAQRRTRRHQSARDVRCAHRRHPRARHDPVAQRHGAAAGRHLPA